MRAARRRITVVAPSVVVPDAPTLTAPADETDVYDGVAVTVSATVTAGQVPDRIDFVLDPGVSEVVVATDSASPYSQSWTPTGVAPGAHTLVARFVYGSGSVDSAAIDLIAWPASTVLALRADLGVTKDGSDLVSEWRDQSASGLVFTAAGGARPTWKSAEIGGRDSIRGDGTASIMSSGALDLSAAFGFTWFGVMKDTTTGPYGYAFEVSTNANAFDGLYTVPMPGVAGVQFCANGASASRYSNFSGTTLAAAAVVSWVHDSTLTGLAQIKAWADGVPMTDLGSGGGADTGAGFGNTNVYLFARAGVVGPWPGDFGGVYLLSEAVSPAVRAALTMALGARYGITVA